MGFDLTFPCWFISGVYLGTSSRDSFAIRLHDLGTWKVVDLCVHPFRKCCNNPRREECQRICSFSKLRDDSEDSRWFIDSAGVLWRIFSFLFFWSKRCFISSFRFGMIFRIITNQSLWKMSSWRFFHESSGLALGASESVPPNRMQLVPSVVLDTVKPGKVKVSKLSGGGERVKLAAVTRSVGWRWRHGNR